MFREYAKKCGYDILTFQEQNEKIKEIDKLIDNQIFEIGKTKLNRRGGTRMGDILYRW